MSRSLRIILISFALTMALASGATAQDRILEGELILIHTDSATTGFFHVMNINLDSLALRNSMIQRLLDSIAGPVSRGEVHILGTCNFSNQTNDSTNLQLSGAVYNSWGLPYDMYLDRFIFRTAEPDSKTPSTFRNDLPIVTTDSALVFRMSRNDSFGAGQKAAITVYKISRSAGLSVNSTTGAFYDMIRFDEALLPTAGTAVQIAFTISLKKNR